MRAPLTVLFLLAAGCGSPTGTCDSPSVVSSWRYAGVQDVPAEASLIGVLSITEACGSLSGQLDLMETDAFGQTRRLTGPLTGRVVDPTGLRFDVLIDGVMRQHLAQVMGDSLTGTWLALHEGAGQAWTGTFAGGREGVK